MCLLRIRLTRLDNTDAVIAEEVVGARKFDLGHVTGDAIFLCDRAYRGSALGGDCEFRLGGMTCMAFRVVECRILFHVAMRIVARDATDARIHAVEALAVGEAVGLEADVVDVVRPLNGDLRPGAVALAAKIRYLLGGELSQWPHGGTLRIVAGPKGIYVRSGVTVAAFALHAWNEVACIQAAGVNGVCGVTSETVGFIFHAHQAPCRLTDIGRRSVG